MTADVIYLVLISTLQFAAVFLLIWSLFRFPVDPEPPISRRIAIAMGIGRRETLFENPAFKPIMALMLTFANRFPFYRQRIREDLEATANPNDYTVEEYLALCMFCGIVFDVVAIFMYAMIGEFDLLVAVVPAVVGFLLPITQLKGMAQKRARRIGKQLPYTLDLIALMLEAGGTFTESVKTMIKDDPSDDLNQELQLVLNEIEFGTGRATALQNLAQRIPLESLNSVVGAINQAESLGTPLSHILKNQSSMIRMLRSVKAEEASATASMRILVPSMLIMMAVVFLVFAPAIMSWMASR